VSRRTLGSLLLVVAPGLASAITVTAYLIAEAASPRGGYLVPDELTLGNWVLAAAGAGTGGLMAASSARSTGLRALAACCGFIFGAAVYFVTMAAMEFLLSPLP